VLHLKWLEGELTRASRPGAGPIRNRRTAQSRLDSHRRGHVWATIFDASHDIADDAHSVLHLPGIMEPRVTLWWWDALAWINRNRQLANGFEAQLMAYPPAWLSRRRSWNSSVPLRLRGHSRGLASRLLRSLLGQRKRLHAATFAIDGIPRSDEQHLSDRSGGRIDRPWHMEGMEQRSTPGIISL